jgi:hypothetical protein
MRSWLLGQAGSKFASTSRYAYRLLMAAGGRTRCRAVAVRLLMLIVGVLATPGAGMDAMQRPHCARHELAAGHRAADVGHDYSQSAWAQQHTHTCQHCPASECARVSPCAASLSVALAPSGAGVYDPQGHRVVTDLDRQQARSAVSSPEPPPPQLIA